MYKRDCTLDEIIKEKLYNGFCKFIKVSRGRICLRLEVTRTNNIGGYGLEVKYIWIKNILKSLKVQSYILIVKSILEQSLGLESDYIFFNYKILI